MLYSSNTIRFAIRKKYYILLLPILFRCHFFRVFVFLGTFLFCHFFALQFISVLIFLLCHCFLFKRHFLKKYFTFFFFAYIFLIYFSLLSVCFLFTLFYIFAVFRSSLTSHLSIFLLLIFSSRFPHPFQSLFFCITLYNHIELEFIDLILSQKSICCPCKKKKQ